MAALSVLSCHSGEPTAPLALGPRRLPADSQPRLTITLPTGAVMTTGTTERIGITAVNIKPQSCLITGSAWLRLAAGADSNAVWTIAPSTSGNAELITTCRDFRNQVVSEFDSLRVEKKPTVTPDISGTVPVDVGDSIDVSYDSTDTKKIDVACKSCDPFATMTRVGPNTLRLFANKVPKDTTHRGICFTVHGLDGRYVQQECVTVAIMAAQAALYSVPQAIRQSEVLSLHTIPVATYDNTGQSNHPDIMRVPAKWSAGACWMVYTPYAGSNGFLENPSLATSPDCEHWKPAPGVQAPLIEKPVDGYNSDPELMYDAARGCLGVVFRQVYTTNTVNITSTCDGTTWSTQRRLFSASNHSAVSPTVTLGPDGFNRIWYVDAGGAGCTSQTNVVKMRVATSDTAALGGVQFGPEVRVDLAQPGYVIWHLKIRYVPEKKEYWAMYAAFPLTTGIGNCMADDLYLATSADGVHWKTFPAPILNHLDRRFKFTSLYRASFLYDAATDHLRTIVSGLESSAWGQYGMIHNYTALVNALNSSSTVAAAQLVPSSKLVRPPDKGVKSVIMEDRP